MFHLSRVLIAQCCLLLSILGASTAARAATDRAAAELEEVIVTASRRAEPIDKALASVSVVDRDSARADALATALMVMGEEAGFAWAQAHGIACIFFLHGDSGIRTRTSPAFSARFGASDPLGMNPKL